MKRFILLSGSLLILFLLVACGGSTEPAAVSSEADAEVQDTVEVAEESAVEAVVEEVIEEEPAIEIAEEPAEEPAPEVVEEPAEEAAVEAVEDSAEEAVIEEEPEEEVAEIETVVEEPAIVDPTDFAMIGQTGRPQFINSYATW